jgi:hypothetical protein
LEKLNKEAMLAYPEVLRMELERLDSLQQNIWPQTQHRKVKMDDGTEVLQEPDLKAVDRVLSIMDRRARLMGLEQSNINVSMDVTSGGEPIRAALAGAQLEERVNQFTPEMEARKLIELMTSSGVISKDMLESMLGSKALELVEATGQQLVEASNTVDLPVDEAGEE